ASRRRGWSFFVRMNLMSTTLLDDRVVGGALACCISTARFSFFLQLRGYGNRFAR
ncbi:MAG: hypothetical protein ACJAV7_000774, partial [Flavobacteriales bacterium]